MLSSERLANYDAIDTPSMKKMRRRELWYLPELGGMIIKWAPKFFIINILYVLLLIINHCYFVVCLFVSIMRTQDINAMCGFLNFMALILIAMIIIAICHIRRNVFLKLLAQCSSEFYNYSGNFLEEHPIEEWKKTAKFHRNLFFGIGIPWLLLIAGSILLSDLVDRVFGYEKSSETVINGLYQNIPMKMWFYHSLDNDVIRYLTILSQIACTGGTALVIGSADLVMFFGGQMIIMQLKILNMAILDTDRRAARLYQLKFGREPPANPIDKTKDRQLMKFYEFCLKQTVEHHGVIIRCSDIYLKIINWPCGIVAVNGSIVVAMSMLGIIQGGGQPSVLVTSILLIIAEIASLFMVCEVGETITYHCEDLFNSMYRFNWMDCSLEVKKTISIMKSCMKKPIILTAGSITPVNRDTFGTIINTAFSYINLVRASRAMDAH